MGRRTTVPAAPETSLSDLVDELGTLRARLAEGEAAEQRIKDQLITRAAEASVDAVDGAVFRALIVRSARSVFDVKAAKVALGSKRVSALTTTAHSVSVRTAPRLEAVVKLAEAA